MGRGGWAVWAPVCWNRSATPTPVMATGAAGQTGPGAREVGGPGTGVARLVT